MHLTEKGILNNSMSVFMHISCTADSLQFKNTDYLGKTSLGNPHVQITFREPAAGMGQRREKEGRNRLWGEGGSVEGARGETELGMLWVNSSATHMAACPTDVTDSSELVCQSMVMALCVLYDAQSLPPVSKLHRYLGIGFRSEPI